MIEIEWIWGLVGGLMIGTAAAMYLLINGRVMGASGILGSLVDGTAKAAAPERIAFIAGLVIIPAVLAAVLGGVDTHISSNLVVIIVAGLLVGIGTRLAYGCTSGHGVCGISRLSLRGIVATVFYLLGGGLMMVLFRHVLGII